MTTNEGGDWLAQVKNLVEQEGTPFLCLYLDQKTKQVNLIADSESQQKLRESKSLIEIEDILIKTNEKKANLQFHDHQQEVVNPCTLWSILHSCHQSTPSIYHQLSWEKNLQNCFKDKSLPVGRYDKLPAEILRIVFGFLEPTDLRSLLLVSQSWKAVAEEPALWTGFDFPEKSRKSSLELTTFMRTSLSSKIHHLTLANNGCGSDDSFSFDLTDEHFRQFLTLNLTSISIWEIELTEVSGELLGKLVAGCKECTIIEVYKSYSLEDDRNLGSEKLSAIFDEMQNQTKLKSFELIAGVHQTFVGDPRKKIDLTSIPSMILATAFTNLEELFLENLEVDSHQLDALFEFGFVNLSSLGFRGIQVDVTRTRNLLESLDKCSRLKRLNLSQVDMREIASQFLARFLNKMISLNIEDIKIESHQFEDIFMAILRGDSVMKHFRMFEISNLSKVSPDVLSKAVNKLESVSFDRRKFLSQGKLSEIQIKEIIRVMSQETSLKSLGMADDLTPVDAYEHIDEVDPKHLAKALNNLESVRLDFGNEDGRYCLFTTAQLYEFFKQLNIKSKLKTIVREDHPEFHM